MRPGKPSMRKIPSKPRPRNGVGQTFAAECAEYSECTARRHNRSRFGVKNRSWREPITVLQGVVSDFQEQRIAWVE
jgi:hypothetical protein